MTVVKLNLDAAGKMRAVKESLAEVEQVDLPPEELAARLQRMAGMLTSAAAQVRRLDKAKKKAAAAAEHKNTQ